MAIADGPSSLSREPEVEQSVQEQALLWRIYEVAELCPGRLELHVIDEALGVNTRSRVTPPPTS